MKSTLICLLLLAGLLQGQPPQSNEDDIIDRLIEEQTKARLIIKCDGLDWAIEITAHGWGRIQHGSSGINQPTGLDCEKIIKDLDLIPDDGNRLPESRPVAFVKLGSGGKLEDYKTFKRDVVARCFIDVADAAYANQGGAEVYFAKRGRPSCLRDTDFQNRNKIAPPQPGDAPPVEGNGNSGKSLPESNKLNKSGVSDYEESGSVSIQAAASRKSHTWPVTTLFLGILVIFFVLIALGRLLRK